MSMNFNDESEKPRFTFKPNPLANHAWQIFEWKAAKENYEPVGDYNLIDLDENRELTEKKLMNLITLMNGRERMIDLSNLTETRLLYTMEESKDPDETHRKIIFRAHDGKGVSTENAVLNIEKGVFDEFDTSNIPASGG